MLTVGKVGVFKSGKQTLTVAVEKILPNGRLVLKVLEEEVAGPRTSSGIPVFLCEPDMDAEKTRLRNKMILESDMNMEHDNIVDTKKIEDIFFSINTRLHYDAPRDELLDSLKLAVKGKGLTKPELMQLWLYVRQKAAKMKKAAEAKQAKVKKVEEKPARSARKQPAKPVETLQPSLLKKLDKAVNVLGTRGVELDDSNYVSLYLLAAYLNHDSVKDFELTPAQEKRVTRMVVADMKVNDVPKALQVAIIEAKNLALFKILVDSNKLLPALQTKVAESNSMPELYEYLVLRAPHFERIMPATWLAINIARVQQDRGLKNWYNRATLKLIEERLTPALRRKFVDADKPAESSVKAVREVSRRRK